MFTLSLQGGFLLYLLLAMSGLAAAMVQDYIRSRNQNWQISGEKISRCNSCNLTFIVGRTETIARCPRCHSLCTKGRL